MATIMVIDDEPSSAGCCGRSGNDQVTQLSKQRWPRSEALISTRSRKPICSIMDLLMPEVGRIGSDPAVDPRIHGYQNHRDDRRPGDRNFLGYRSALRRPPDVRKASI